jgi:predicted aldo/keto reductase-like oxidoreductase
MSQYSSTGTGGYQLRVVNSADIIWVKSPAVAAVMVGCSTPEEIDAAVEYENAAEDQKDYASVLANAPYHAYTGQCTYCGHCAPCPSYIDIAMVNKLYDLAVMQETTPATIQAHYIALSANASDCIGCAACEKRCPFKVPVVERMKKAVQLFA